MATVGQLALDLAGVSESRGAAWDYKNFPEIVAGDSILSSPAPVIVSLPTSPALTFSGISVSGTQVQALVSVIGGIVNTMYQTSCRVQTANGRTLVNDNLNILLINRS